MNTETVLLILKKKQIEESSQHYADESEAIQNEIRSEKSKIASFIKSQRLSITDYRKRREEERKNRERMEIEARKRR